MSEESATKRFGTTKIAKLTISPFTKMLDIGHANHGGYWDFDHMCLQFEDMVDALKELFPHFDFWKECLDSLVPCTIQNQAHSVGKTMMMYYVCLHICTRICPANMNDVAMIWPLHTICVWMKEWHCLSLYNCVHILHIWDPLAT